MGECSMRKWLVWVLAGTFPCLCIALCAVYYWPMPWLKERETEMAMAQLGKAMLLYAQQSPREAFPPKCREKNVFLPDMDALETVSPGIKQDPRIKAFLENRNGRPLCYLGHVVAFPEMMDILLKSYADDTSDSVRDAEIPTGIDAQYSAIMRLRIGIARHFIWDIGNPAAYPMAQHAFPVFWEMPKAGEDEFLICFADGHVERVGYPLCLPDYRPNPLNVLSVHSLNAIRRVLSLPFDPEPPVIPPDSPVAKPIQAALETSLHWATSFDCLSLSSAPAVFDVYAAGAKGYYVNLGSELILFPDTVDVSPVHPEELPFCGDPSELSSWPNMALYLGKGLGFHWYARTSQQFQKTLREKLNLLGGEDVYPFVAKKYAYKINIPTPAKDIEGLPPEKRIPVLKAVLEKPETLQDYANAYFLLRESEGNPVTQDLLDAGGVLTACPLWPNKMRFSTGFSGEAAKRLISAQDMGATAVFALMAAGKSDAWGKRWQWSQSNHAVRFLRQFPREPVQALLGQLADRVSDPMQRDYLRTLLDLLNAPELSQ